MRIAVTGATGFVGNHLCARLRSLGHEVTAVHRASSAIETIRALGVTAISCELDDPAGLRYAFHGHGAAIHAAADLQYWSARAAEQERINTGGTANVAEACAAESIRLVHISSTAAIGIPDDSAHPADETFAFNLAGTGLHYNLSKKRAEDEVLRRVARGLDAVIVNPASIFGPHRGGFRGGEMIRKVAHGAVATYFTGGICAVHVDDVIDGILAALERGRKGERYILGGENISYREITRRSLAAMNLKKPMIPVPPLVTGILAAVMEPAGRWRNRRPRFTPEIHYGSYRFQYYSSEKARRELGYAPRDFEAILRECLGKT